MDEGGGEQEEWALWMEEENRRCLKATLTERLLLPRRRGFKHHYRRSAGIRGGRERDREGERERESENESERARDREREL